MNVSQAPVPPASAGPDLDQPLVSVAILAYNRRDALARTLEALRDRLDYPANRLEVIVVDNASEDGTAEMVRHEFPEVQLVETRENLGVPGWNLAFEAARGEYILVLDDDCYVEGSALRDALRAAREHDADLVSFFVKSPGDQIDFSEDFKPGLLAFWGCSALIGRRALERLGGYDSNIFLWGHEAEFVMRLLDTGYAHLHMPQVTSLHQKAVGGYSERGYRLNARHHAYIATKLMRPVDAFVCIWRLALDVVGNSASNGGGLGAFREVVGGSRRGMRARQPVGADVSRLYRRNFLLFASPLLFIRGPLARWRTRREEDGAARERRRRLDRFIAARPSLYPADGGVLRMRRPR